MDDIRLEAQIDAPATDLPESAGIPRTLSQLAMRKKVVIAALGDSITSGYRLEKPDRDAWPAQLEKRLRKQFDYKGIDVRNRGIGGLETRQAIALLPRDIGLDPPDLAIVHFGYNDLTAMEERRIPEETRREIVLRNFRELVLRIRAHSRGRTEVLLMATVPGGDRARRNALDFFGQEAAEVAGELRCGFTDAPRTAYRELLERDGPKALFAQLPDGRQDVSHPHAEGQRIFAEALLNAFEQAGKQP
jgi:lysophospholipase L1-like esterase